MNSPFNIKDHKEGKIIRLTRPLQDRTRILDLFNAFLFFIGTLGFLYTFLTNPGASIVAIIFMLLAIVGFGIASARFINRAFESEKIFVNKIRVDLITSSLLKTKTRSFAISDISGLRFNERPKYEPHPLSGKTFDYLGFQTEQQLIQHLHAEGRVSFMYKGYQIRFGKDMVQWEFNELEVLLYDLTGNDLRYTDEFEKENFPKE